MEEEEDKKKGKLDPLVKVFLRKQIEEQEKEEKFKHPPIDQLERYRNNYKEALLKEDEHFSRYMNDWAAKRSRFKTEASRKIQCIRMTHNNTAKLSTEPTFEEGIYYNRINETIRDCRNYVKG